jgi:hypothetical protein
MVVRGFEETAGMKVLLVNGPYIQIHQVSRNGSLKRCGLSNLSVVLKQSKNMVQK